MLQWMRCWPELNAVTIPIQSKLAANNYDNWLIDFSHFPSKNVEHASLDCMLNRRSYSKASLWAPENEHCSQLINLIVFFISM